jgi:hypothetical protein
MQPRSVKPVCAVVVLPELYVIACDVGLAMKAVEEEVPGDG